LAVSFRQGEAADSGFDNGYQPLIFTDETQIKQIRVSSVFHPWHFED
jgi:hypothetical protein